MAATPKDKQKIELDYRVDREIYNGFIKSCSSKGFAPNVVVERMMKRYTETGQF
mgnify:CR=1 FL=1